MVFVVGESVTLISRGVAGIEISLLHNELKYIYFDRSILVGFDDIWGNFDRGTF